MTTATLKPALLVEAVDQVLQAQQVLALPPKLQIIPSRFYHCTGCGLSYLTKEGRAACMRSHRR